MSEFLHKIERELRRRHYTPAQIWTRRIVLFTLLLLTPAIAMEVLLRATGYIRPQVDPDMQSKTMRECVAALNQRFNTTAFVEDLHLLWRLQPGANLAGVDVSLEGLLGSGKSNPLDVRTHTAERILCMGDSVTAVTYRTYPETAQRLANSVALEKPVEIRNAAVPGYTTEQGLRWLDRLKDWRPDIVLLCFGWNDQFTALNIPDRELGYTNGAATVLHRMLGRVRLYQLLAAPVEARLLINGHRESAHSAPSDHVNIQQRVSPEQYEENLRALVQRARSMGALPVLLTQPENLSEASERNLEARNFISPDVGTAIKVHHRYNNIVRRVATDTHTPLVDLDEEFVRRKRENFFEADGIHMTGRGHNHVARLLLALLRDEGKITTAEYDAIARAEKHDTTAPDKPRAAWSVVPPHIDATTTDTLAFGVVAHNVGNTRWLREHLIPRFGNRVDVPYGGVSVVGTWRTIDSPSANTAAEAHLPSDILPGETTSVTLTLGAPAKPGSYEMEIGLRADAIGDLKLFGAETTTFTVTTRP